MNSGMPRVGLKDIPLNDYALSILKDAEWFVEDENYKAVKLQCEKHLGEGDKFTNDEYMYHIMEMGNKHDGFPEIILGHSFSTNNLRFVGNDPTMPEKINSKLLEVIEKLAIEFTLKKNALFCVYPESGFISWHNNANAPAYNFIFTWSETGDGWFKWYNQETKEVVTVHDKAGWQCKAGYFGPYEGPSNALCYHAAHTNCLRMTIAFTLSMGEVSMGLQDWIIEDISADSL